MTSAVTSMPCALAQRSTSTEPAVETWATWTREPVWRASITSRATITSSAMPGPAGQAEAPGQLALVAARRRSGECRVLGVLGDDAAERLDVLQRASHHAGVVDALPVVGEDGDAGSRAVHQPELGELLAAETAGDRADRLDVDESGLAAELPDAGGGLGGVGDGTRVGHREDRRVTAERGGLRAGEHGLGVLAAGLAQVGVQVDEPGQRDESVGVEGLRAARCLLDEHPRVVDVEVRGLLAEQRGSGDHEGHQASSPASRW